MKSWKSASRFHLGLCFGQRGAPRGRAVSTKGKFHTESPHRVLEGRVAGMRGQRLESDSPDASPLAVPLPSSPHPKMEKS